MHAKPVVHVLQLRDFRPCEYDIHQAPPISTGHFSRGIFPNTFYDQCRFGTILDGYGSPKININTKNDGLDNVSNTAILSIHLKFLGYDIRISFHPAGCSYYLQWPLELDFFAAWDEAAGGCILRICEFLWSFWGFTIQIWSEPQVDGVLFIFCGDLGK